VRKLARDGVASKRSSTHATLCLFQEAHKLAFHACSAILESFFYACSDIVDSFVIAFFVKNIIFCSIIVDKHAMFVPDYANVLVKVFAFVGVINRVPATTPAHNVFCYSAVAHILTPSVKLAFGSESGFKNKCRARAGFAPRPGFKMRPFYNSVWVCMQGPTRGE